MLFSFGPVVAPSLLPTDRQTDLPTVVRSVERGQGGGRRATRSWEGVCVIDGRPPNLGRKTREVCPRERKRRRTDAQFLHIGDKGGERTGGVGFAPARAMAVPVLPPGGSGGAVIVSGGSGLDGDGDLRSCPCSGPARAETAPRATE